VAIADTTVDFMDGHLNPDKERDIRAFLAPMGRLANLRSFTFVGSVHINKDRSATARNAFWAGWPGATPPATSCSWPCPTARTRTTPSAWW
jgi:hypothetical protein